MSRFAKLNVVTLGAVVFLGVALYLIGSAEARAPYRKAFMEQYPAVKEEAEKAKCNICHVPEKEKKERNVYGTTVCKLLGGKECKDAAKVVEALKKAEAEKTADGKTFGELLKAGKLPVAK